MISFQLTSMLIATAHSLALGLLLGLFGSTADVRELLPSRDELQPCSGSQEIRAMVGPEGGRLRLARFEFVVYPGALSEETALIVRRTPADPSKPGRCSLRDVYSVEPFFLMSTPGRPFAAYWYWSASDEELEKLPTSVCPKISWTEDQERLECYQLAEDVAESEWRINPRTGSPWPTGSYSRNDNACMRTDLVRRMPVMRSGFKTDRLGHFRLLAPEEGGLPDGQRRRWSSEEHPGSAPAEGCVEIPDIGLRLLRVVTQSDGAIARVEWQPSCDEESACADGTYCRRPEGRCAAMGVCRSLPVEGYQPPSRASDHEDSRVCSCDGRTFTSRFEAWRSGVSIRSTGPCPNPEEGGSPDENPR